MKLSHCFSVVFIFFPVFMCFTQTLEYGDYLPDFKSDFSYPSTSQLITYDLSQDKKLIIISVSQSVSFDAVDRQLIKNMLADEKPDLCILQGFSDTEGISPKRIIELADNLYSRKIGGENTYAAYWCNQLNIPFMGCSLHGPTHFAALQSLGYSQIDLVFYMLLLQIPYWDKDGLLEENNLANQFETFMHEKLKLWYHIQVNYSYQDFLEWFRQQYKRRYVVNDPEFVWHVQPEKSWVSKREDALIHQKITADFHNLNSNNAIAVIKRAIAKYNKVIVVYGASATGNHYVWQKSALASFLGAPTRVENI